MPQEAAKETLRIKIALDNASSSVMMADNDEIIRYQNKACIALMHGSENGFRKQFPGFSAAAVQGASLDYFHKNANLKGEHRTRIQIGGLHMRLVVDPIADEKGTPLGTVVEWNDVTAEVNAKTETIAKGSAAGNSRSAPEPLLCDT